MNPDPRSTEDRFGNGHIPCVVCRHTIALDQYRQARCWTDPHGITCAAHVACLRALGETDLGLAGDAA